MTLPKAGEYTISLETTVGTCSTNLNDDESLTDFDYVSFKTEYECPQSDTINIKIGHPDCNPLRLHIESDAEPSGGACNWKIKKPDGTLLVSINQCSFDYTFPSVPGVNQSYSIELEYTVFPCTPVTRIMALDAAVFSNAFNPDFDFTYLACQPNGQFPTTFKNMSTPNNCSGTTWKWEFGDGGMSAEYEPTPHTYAIARDYQVTLTMTRNGVSVSKTKIITIAPFDLSDYNPTATPCPDGTVVFEVDVDFCDAFVRGTHDWSFPGGSVHSTGKSTSNKRKVKVSYPDGTHTATLSIKNCDGAVCITNMTFQVANIVGHCCKRDKRKQTDYFSYSGNEYRMISKFRSFGGLRTIFVKTKLQKKSKNDNWWRKKAYEIKAAYSGHLYFTTAAGCDCVLDKMVSESNINPPPFRRAKAAKREIVFYDGLNFRPFRMRCRSITSMHSVQVDAGHTPFQVMLPLCICD